MAASFTVTLDTTPPDAALGTPEYTPLSRHLHVPYTVSEPGIASADYIEDSTGTRVALGILTDELFGQLPVGVGRPGTVEVLARDDVMNSALVTIPVTGFVSVLSAAVSAVARFAGAIASRTPLTGRADAHGSIEGMTDGEAPITGAQTARQG